ncbi:MAG: choice-of-anchor Q domain-containing protein [Thermodesulfobacteriota bacterium]|nr:choice-of-anchor Q domain-containing protein [Thermodesulfobacteriota bacterium]
MNPITLDPLFVDSAHGNFQFQLTSPAIDAGSSEVAFIVTRDFEGTTQPQGSGYDIGPYEYVAAILVGDLNGDDLVNTQDIHACVSHILGTHDWGSAADVNEDGSVDVLDVQES